VSDSETPLQRKNPFTSLTDQHIAVGGIAAIGSVGILEGIERDSNNSDTTVVADFLLMAVLVLTLPGTY